MNISQNDTAVVITDPQNDVLSEKGVGWGLVGDNSVSFYEALPGSGRSLAAN